MSKSMPIFDEDDEVNLVKTYVKQVPTITSLYSITYNDDVPASKVLVSDTKTLSVAWSEAPDFHIRVGFIPKIGNALMTNGVITGTLTPYGYFTEDAASWKEFTYIYNQVTFSKGTYGGIKKIRFHPAKFPYQCMIYAKKAGATYYWRGVIEPQDKILEFPGFYFDDDGTHDLWIRLYYYDSGTSVLAGNVYESDASNYGVLTRALADEIQISLDMYNEFDKGYLPVALATGVDLDEAAADIIEDSVDTMIAASAMGINARELAEQITKALTYAEAQGWMSMYEVVNDADKLSMLLGKVAGAFMYLTKEQSFAEVAIPDHFDQVLNSIRRAGADESNYTLLCAVVGAIDDISLVTRPAS